MISLVTVDPQSGTPEEGYSTAAAVVYTMRNSNPYKPNDPQTWYPIYLASRVSPTIDLVIGYNKANPSPTLQLFLSRADELIARVSKRLSDPAVTA
jgi:hypothetical protein